MEFISARRGQGPAVKLQVYKSGYQLPVLKSHQLLSAGRHQGLLQQVREISGLDDAHFELLYEGAVNQLVEFVQVLPAQQNGALSTLMNQSLARAVLALKQFAFNREDAEPDPLLNYACFTSALLMDVAKVVVNQKIVIVNNDGEYVEEWRPFEKSLVDLNATFYKIYPIAPVYQRLDKAITPLLARQLLPEAGFLWLASDPDVLADWLDALNQDDVRGGRVSHTLTLVEPEDVEDLVDSLVPVAVEQVEPIDNTLGEDFLTWLKNLFEEDIEVNAPDSEVHIVEEGMFIERKMFKRYVDMMNIAEHADKVFAQFGNLMGISTEFLGTKYLSHYPSDAPKGMHISPLSRQGTAMRVGVVIDPITVITSGQFPAVSPMLKAMQHIGKQSHQLPPVVRSDKTFQRK